MIKPDKYYFSPASIEMKLNASSGGAFTPSETIQVVAAMGAAVRVANQLTTEAEKILNLGYNAQLGYRQFNFTGVNTVLGYPGNKYIDANIYAYLRLDASDNGSTGDLIFLPYLLDYDGTVLGEGTPPTYEDITIVTKEDEEGKKYYTLPNEDDENASGLTYYYIHIASISKPDSGKRNWLDLLNNGQLDTAKGNNEKASAALEKMFKLVNNVIHVLLPLDKITFQKSGTAAFIDRIITTVSESLDDFAAWASTSAIATTASVASYISAQLKSLDSRFFRKDQDDASPHTATFGNLIIAKLPLPDNETSSGNLSVEGNSSVEGDLNVEGKATFKQSVHALKEIVLGLNAEGKDKVLRSAIYEAGMKGWAVDKNGNAELESLKVRGYLETEELRINRLQGQEGDTIFTDNDRIEAVVEEVDETDGTTYYTLTLAEKWEGYFTAQQYGNICKGIVNTLAENYLAQQQGREPYVDINASGQEADAGGNKYFTSWFYVVATHNTDSRLGLNQIRVVLFGETQIPQDKNFAPCVGMSFGRWGCLNYATSDTPDYELADIKRRQSLFYISVSEGRIMHLKGVYQPILESWMFGTTMGELPDFVKNNESIKDRLVDNADYFYSQGVVVSDFIKIGATGVPIPVTWFCGDWVDGSTIDNPTIGNGIYLASEYNPDNRQYEVHEVRHKSGRWRCLQHQPVVINGEAVYHEPKWNSHYWRLVDGNENYSILFQSSRGMSFHRGHVDTEVTPRLMYGNVDISDDVAEQFWSWKRYTDTGETLADKAWSAQHEGVRVLHLTNEDMSQEWNSRNRAIFEVSVTLDDGITQIIISNYIIA